MEKPLSVRSAVQADFPIIEALHCSGGLDYRLPDLTSPLIIANKVAVGPEGVIGSVFLRLTAEAFLLLDPALDARRKLDTIQALQPEILLEAWSLGLEDLNARIPPEINQRFAKRLHQLGWNQGRSGWAAWSKRVTSAG